MLIAGLLSAGPADSRGLTVIRDAEIEHTLRSWTTPLLEAAGLDSDAVRLHVVRDPQVNAFVARGQNMFVATGLLTQATHPDQIVGVLAHEIGHIAAGHLARLRGAIEDARNQALIGTLAGWAVGVLARSGAAAAGLSAKALDVAQAHLAGYTRAQERSADRIAVDILRRTGVSPRGLLDLFREIERREPAPGERSAYLRTHPLTRDRIVFVRDQIARAPETDVRAPARRLAAFDRMQAKLKGFLDPPARTLRAFAADDSSVKVRYARAVALYRDARIDGALEVLDGLLREFPDDPYFHELRGQVLFENGRLEEALPAYERAARLAPDEPLLRVGLAHVRIELGRPELLAAALSALETALRRDRRLPDAWRLSAIAYGRAGRLGMSALAQAENELLAGRLRAASGQARKAARLLDAGSPARQRARDIAALADRLSGNGRRREGK